MCTIYVDAFFGFPGDDLWVLGRKGRCLIAVNGAFVHLSEVWGDDLGEESATGLHDLEAGCGTNGGERGCECHRDEHEGR